MADGDPGSQHGPPPSPIPRETPKSLQLTLSTPLAPTLPTQATCCLEAHSWSPCTVRGVFPKLKLGDSLVVQWLECRASTTGDKGWIPGQGTKIPQAPQFGQKNKTKDSILTSARNLLWLPSALGSKPEGYTSVPGPLTAACLHPPFRFSKRSQCSPPSDTSPGASGLSGNIRAPRMVSPDLHETGLILSFLLFLFHVPLHTAPFTEK